MTSRKYCEMEHPNQSAGGSPSSRSPSIPNPNSVYDDIGLDPRAAEKLKILVNDLNLHVAKLYQVIMENPDGTVRDGFVEEFSVRHGSRLSHSTHDRALRERAPLTFTLATVPALGKFITGRRIATQMCYRVCCFRATSLANKRIQMRTLV